MVLVLGPLYHLTAAGDRGQALAGFGELDEAAASKVARLIETGINQDDPTGFTTAYFHRADDLAQEMTAAGLTDVRVLGVEGPSVPALDNASTESADTVFASAVLCAELVEADPALLSASPHFLGLGRVT